MPITIGASLPENHTDGLVIQHRGGVAFERYPGVLDEGGQHGLMSVTKSVVGPCAETPVAAESLELSQRVVEYVPMPGALAFGDATVRRVMGMTAGLRFSEDCADPEAGASAHAAADDSLPRAEGFASPRSRRALLVMVRLGCRFGAALGCRTANPTPRRRVIARAMGYSLAQLLSEQVWRTLGTEQGANMTVNSTGTPFARCAFNARLRDVLPFGAVARRDGYHSGRQMVLSAAIAHTRRGGRKEDFAEAGYRRLPGWRDRSMGWGMHDVHRAVGARAVPGQTPCIDPAAELVVACFASRPVPANAANDASSPPAWQAPAPHRMDKDR